MKKKMLCIMLATSILFASGCQTTQESTSTGNNEEVTAAEEPQEEKEESQEKQKLVVWSRDAQDSQVGIAVESDAAAFMEAYPNVEVEILHIPHEDVVTKWNTAFAGGTAPDVMDVGVSHIVGRVDLGHLLPLDDYYNEWEEKDSLAESMVEYGRYDDHIYALAYNAAPHVMVWRKDYFEEAGLDPNSPPANWEQVLEYAEKLTIVEDGIVTQGAVDLPATSGASILVQFFIQNQVHENTYIDGPNFTDSEILKAADFLNDLSDYAILSQTGYDAFATGNAAMALSTHVPTIKSWIEEDPSLADKLGYAPSLTEAQGGIHAGAWLYSISSQCENPDLAWEWIKFIFSEERSLARMYETGMIPPLDSLREDYMAEGGEEFALLHEAQMANMQQSFAYPKISWSSLYEEQLNIGYDEIIYDIKTPEQAMQDVEETLKNKISD